MAKPETSKEAKPKLKQINIPDAAKVELARMSQNLDNYIKGMVTGLGVKGKWTFDMKSMQLFVEDK